LRRLPPDAGLLRHQELPGGRAQLLPPRRHLPGLQALLLLLGHATAPVEWEERGVRGETHTHTHTHTHTLSHQHTHTLQSHRALYSTHSSHTHSPDTHTLQTHTLSSHTHTLQSHTLQSHTRTLSPD